MSEAMFTCGTGGGDSIACRVIFPAAAMSRPVTDVVGAFAAVGLTDIASQFAFAAGDARVMTFGSVLQAEAILRHIEEVFEDLSEVQVSSFSLLDHSPASDWHESASLARRLLTAHSSAFRVKRSKPATHAALTDPHKIQVTVGSDLKPMTQATYKLHLSYSHPYVGLSDLERQAVADAFHRLAKLPNA